MVFFRSIFFLTQITPWHGATCSQRSRDYPWSFSEHRILTGPALLQNLIHVLFCFRQHQYAVSADIEGMFLQVGVIPTYQPSFRFSQQQNPATNVAVVQYIQNISCAKDLTACAYYALQKTASNDARQNLEAARSVQENCYMDDYLESSDFSGKLEKRLKTSSVCHV